MSSEPVAVGGLGIEGISVAGDGIRFFAGDLEVFMAYQDFPWLKDEPIVKILNVAAPTTEQFSWPDLGLYISIESIQQAEFSSANPKSAA